MLPVPADDATAPLLEALALLEDAVLDVLDDPFPAFDVMTRFGLPPEVYVLLPVSLPPPPREPRS